MSAEDALYRRFADVVGVKLTTEKDGTISAEKAKEASVSLEEVAIASFFDEIEKISKDLTVEDKEKLPKKDFAQPNKEEEGHKGKYPIPDRQHAASALGFAKMHHDSGAEAAVRRKVEAKFPDMVDKK